MSTREEIEDLIVLEARLLDELRYQEWLELLTDDFSYEVPLSAEGVEELAIIREDRFRIEARVWRIGQTGLNHSQDPPSRTVRSVSNIEVDVDVDTATAYFVAVLYEWRPQGQRLERGVHTLPMRCLYRFRKESGRWLICHRQLVLLQRDGDLPTMTYLV